MMVVSVTSNDVAKKGGTTVRSYAGGPLGVPTFALEDVGTTDVANVGMSMSLKSEVTMVARLAGSDTTVAFGDMFVEMTSVTTVDEVVTGTTNNKMMVACATLAFGKKAGEIAEPGGSSGYVLTTGANLVSLVDTTYCGGPTLVLTYSPKNQYQAVRDTLPWYAVPPTKRRVCGRRTRLRSGGWL